MDTFTREDLQELLTMEGDLFISLYMPMVVAGPETRQNPIRFKNLVRAAEAQLVELGMDENDAAHFLEPVHALDRYEFWQHQDLGLAIFCSAHGMRRYCLPVPFPELAVVTDHFHIKPLLPLLTGNFRFYILALAQNGSRVLRCTRHTVREVPVAEMPANLAEVLQYDITEKYLQSRNATPGATGPAASAQQAGVFHGQGEGVAHHKSDILQYFYQIDDALQKDLLNREQAPLILAGVDYLLPLYREANSYRHLIEAGISGSPENRTDEELHALAVPLVEPIFQAAFDEAVGHYRAKAGTGQTSRDLAEVVQGAVYARVDTLFVPVGIQKWGSFDPIENQIRVHDEFQPGDEDLLDLAAARTVANGGTVWALPPERMPDGSEVVAVFRY
jgi:hypothetical protein